MMNQLHQAFCTVSAPAKAILCGEHAVVYGKDAIALALGLHCTATLYRKAKQVQYAQIVIHSQLEREVRIQPNLMGLLASKFAFKQNYSYDEFEQDLQKTQYEAVSRFSLSVHFKLSLLLATVKMEWKQWQQVSSFDYEVDVKSDIPIGKCLGSSAAFNTVLATATLIILGKLFPQCALSPAEKDQINSISVSFERIQHGTPSGIDNFISVHGGVILYNKSKEPRFKQLHTAAGNIKRLMNVGIIDTGINKNTKTAVSNVRQKYESSHQYKAMIEEIGEISTQAANIIEDSQCNTGSIEQLLKLASRNHYLLRQLGVSHSSIQKVVSEWSNRQWSAKVTGSGMGGCVLLLSHRHNQHQHGVILAQLDEKGLTVTPISQ